MRKGVCLTILAALVFLVGCFKAENKGQSPPTPVEVGEPKEAILYKVSAEELAKEFHDKPEEAKKKYDPNPPKPRTMGGARVEVTGELEKEKGKNLWLKTDSEVKVVLRAESVKGEKEGARYATGQGKFKDFKDKIITIEVGEVELKRIIGDKKQRGFDSP